ncbi:hypothetical protein [Calothrix sp. NIES-2098]|uniref:hypothetical protein n=1 Tax=Calothrix sp. NIES-2098 TaxID=1954171 RepID=UPI000B5DD964|nr:hypothetical protein NIES2098_14540 [Calothrix sp. NIES-2098]
MSYYNFNDHFWSAKKVCCQTTQDKSNKTIANKKIIVAMLSLAFIFVGAPLLLSQILTASNEHQGEVSLNQNLGNKCILVGRKPLQIHCSVK